MKSLLIVADRLTFFLNLEMLAARGIYDMLTIRWRGNGLNI